MSNSSNFCYKRGVSQQDQFDKLRELLKKNHTFPGPYTHKFIGKNSEIFQESVREFEKKFIGLTRISERQSASGAHLSLTYEYIASSPEDIVQLAIETHKINDLIYVL